MGSGTSFSAKIDLIYFENGKTLQADLLAPQAQGLVVESGVLSDGIPIAFNTHERKRTWANRHE